MGRPTIVCDKDDRLIVIYRDNEGANGLTVVHSLPRALDPQRLVWTQFDLTTDTLAGFDAPNVDLVRWEQDNVLHVYYQPVNGQEQYVVYVLDVDVLLCRRAQATPTLCVHVGDVAERGPAPAGPLSSGFFRVAGLS